MANEKLAWGPSVFPTQKKDEVVDEVHETFLTRMGRRPAHQCRITGAS